jgi:plastocyanin
MKKIFAVSLILLAAALAIAGCSKNKSTNSNLPPVPGNGVTIQGFAFSPSNMSVSVGDTVVWTNRDGVAHTVTSNTGIWDSGTLGQNQSFTRVFSSAGSFPYHCTIHPSMTGTITVQ